MSASERPWSRRAGGHAWRETWKKALAATQGNALVAFAALLPALLGLSFAILDFSLLIFDYHRAGEATRRGARTAAIIDPIADLGALPGGGSVVCTGGTALSCTGGAVTDAGGFTRILSEMQAIHAGIGSGNIKVEYRPSGLGDPSSPGGILPLITVRLVGLRHEMTMLQAVPGMPAEITYPDFATAHLGSGVQP